MVSHNNTEDKDKHYKALSILLMLLGVSFLVLLVTYDLRYSSLNSTSIYYSSNVFYDFRNLISDLLFQVFGQTIYILPITLLIWSYKLFVDYKIEFWKAKVLLLLMLLVLSPPLFYSNFDEYNAGIIGFFIAQYVNIFSQWSVVFIVVCFATFLFVSSLGRKDIFLLYLLIDKIYQKSYYLVKRIICLIKDKFSNKSKIDFNTLKSEGDILNIAPDIDFIVKEAHKNIHSSDKIRDSLQDSEYQSGSSSDYSYQKSNRRFKEKEQNSPKIGFFSWFKSKIIKNNESSSEDLIVNKSYNNKNYQAADSNSNTELDNFNARLRETTQQALKDMQSLRDIQLELSNNKQYHSNSEHDLQSRIASNSRHINPNNGENITKEIPHSTPKSQSSYGDGYDDNKYGDKIAPPGKIPLPNAKKVLASKEVENYHFQGKDCNYVEEIETEQPEDYGVSLDFLDIKKSSIGGITAREAKEYAAKLESIINEFGINGRIVSVKSGPVVTLYEISIPAGVKTAKLIALETDIALRMKAVSVRIAVVTGKDVIGIEIPNVKRKTIFLKEIFKRSEFENSQAELPLALGYDIYGNAIVADLVTMPHLLIAGTTGSGKSVGVNSMILSMLYKLPPDQCKLILIDPKMLELSVYQDIPHLLTPVVINPKEAITALKWVVKEMEFRYYQMSLLGVRNVRGFNDKIKNTTWLEKTKQKLLQDKGIELEFNYMPYIVVIIDEMADLMMVAGKEVEGAVQRLAQMARASGIHLIMATQRPSADVITGTIKSNFPTRVSFQVSSHIDSRIILGENGGERLLGRGDMLYMSGVGRIQRVHGPFVSDDEVQKVVSYLKTLGKPNYVNNVTSSLVLDGDLDEERDELYEDAINVIQQEGKVSTSFLQRKFQIGYNRAARIVEQLEAGGVVSKPSNSGKREILLKYVIVLWL